LRDNLPKNWPHDGKPLIDVWREDGIPIVYVTRAEIVRAILEEDDYDSRMKVLVANRHDVADDCRAAINPKLLHPLAADLDELIETDSRHGSAHG
jgi:hypothetical protein